MFLAFHVPLSFAGHLARQLVRKKENESNQGASFEFEMHFSVVKTPYVLKKTRRSV